MNAYSFQCDIESVARELDILTPDVELETIQAESGATTEIAVVTWKCKRVMPAQVWFDAISRRMS